MGLSIPNRLEKSILLLNVTELFYCFYIGNTTLEEYYCKVLGPRNP